MPQKITAARPTSSRLLTRKIASRESRDSIRFGRAKVVEPRDDQERRADHHHRDQAQQRRADRGGAEGMDRLQDARADQEGAEQRKRERPADQGDVPHLEHPPPLLDHDRVQEGGPHQPRHQRGVLDRVPPPVAAPPELRVGPAGARAGSRSPGTARRSARSAGSRGSSSRRGVGWPARRSRTRTGSRRRRSPSRASAGGWPSPGGAAAAPGRPPQAAPGLRRANGFASNSISPVKKTPSPMSTAVAHGASSRCLLPGREQHRRRGQREHPGPQQQRALLAGPHRGQLVEAGGGGR